MPLNNKMSTNQKAKSLFYEGAGHIQAGDYSRAEECFKEAIRIAPNFAEAHANLGFILDKKGALREAEIHYRISLKLKQNCLEVYLNLGSLLTTQKRFDEAWDIYETAVTIAPKSPAIWSNLGIFYTCQKLDANAEKCYRRAIELDETYGAARFNLSYLLLRHGNFEEGWRYFEARDWYASLERYFDCPRWRGEPLNAKSMLIGYEAGHGDMIQFCRYAAVIKSLGASHITLVCHPALKRLFATLGPVDKIIAFNEDVPRSGWDFWTPPFSIPYYCKTRADSIPAEIPYLHPQPDLVAKWERELPAQGVRVGLVWKGNPKFENDSERSIESLDMLKPLGSVPGISFISLQKGPGENEAMQPIEGLPLIHLGGRIEDFADTAAIITNLDLIICVDTGAAHLAGALGKPCWVLLPDFVTDWRWLNGRSDSLWYPGVMRLFRQSETGSWQEVISEVAEALKLFAKERRR